MIFSEKLVYFSGSYSRQMRFESRRNHAMAGISTAPGDPGGGDGGEKHEDDRHGPVQPALKPVAAAAQHDVADQAQAELALDEARRR